MINTNCKNCGAPYSPGVAVCEYCRTIAVLVQPPPIKGYREGGTVTYFDNIAEVVSQAIAGFGRDTQRRVAEGLAMYPRGTVMNKKNY